MQAARSAKKQSENMLISTIEFGPKIPLDDCDLIGELCKHGTPELHLRFERTSVHALRRVMHAASMGAGIEVKRVNVDELSMLTSYDRHEFQSADGFLPETMRSLLDVSLSIKFQKNVQNQTQNHKLNKMKRKLNNMNNRRRSI